MNWDIRRFDTIDSTNRYVLEQAAEGAAAGLVVAAGHQTAGRGRRGRVWDSKPGASLLVSILFRPDSDEVVARYPQAVGLAVNDATALVGGFASALKWPNDVVVDDKKLAGILAESVTGQEATLVVGCGINLNWDGEMPDALRETATSADEHAGHAIDSDLFLDAMLRALGERLARPTWISEAYRQRCVTLGTVVRVEQSDAIVIGTAQSVTDSGALVVRTQNGDTTEITIGDVVHVRS